MPKIRTLPSVQLPAIRVEPALHEALTLIAVEQGRSLSDVIRSLLREPKAFASVRLPPVRVEPALVKALVDLANIEGRALSDVMRSCLRERIEQRKAGP